MQKIREKRKLYQPLRPRNVKACSPTAQVFLDSLRRILIPLSWCSQYPTPHQAMVHSLAWPFQCSQLCFHENSSHQRDAKVKKSHVAESWVPWIQAAWDKHICSHLIKFLVSPLHAHTHTYLHPQMSSLSELALLDSVDNLEVFEKPSPNN